MLWSRLVRIAGIFAVGLAGLVAASGSASAASCVLSFSPGTGAAGGTLSINAGAGADLSGTTSVTVGSSAAAILSTSSTLVTVTIPTEPAPTVTGIITNYGLFLPSGIGPYGGTNGGDTFIITGTNFNPTVDVTIGGGACAATYGSVFTYNDVTAVDIGGTRRRPSPSTIPPPSPEQHRLEF